MSKPTDYNYWLGVVGFSNTEAAIALNLEFNRLEAQLAAAEAVCEAAEAARKPSIWSPEDMLRGVDEALEAWRKLREDKP